MSRSNAFVLFKDNFHFEFVYVCVCVCGGGTVCKLKVDEIRSALCGFHFCAFSPLLSTVFDATASFKMQPTDITDLHGSHHVLHSHLLGRYFKYTREILNAPTKNNESIEIVKCVYIKNNS